MAKTKRLANTWYLIPWPECKEDLTVEEASWIRYEKFRGHTWRSISVAYCEQFYPKAKDWPVCSGNQIHGVDLCKYAAEWFGEDYMDENWNG